jgi:hypothetical protein
VSSAGRGPRLGGPDDFYVTPSWCVDRLLERFSPRKGWMLEPAAGTGAIIAAVNAVIGDQTWMAVECRATAAPACRDVGANPVIADFLTWVPPAHVMENVTTVITNPPFALCEEFIRQAYGIFAAADLAFLVRLGFLASEKRVKLWRDVGMPDVLVLPNRPSFVESGATDSADYCWILLPAEPREQGTFEVLESTPKAVRRPVRGKKAA